MFPWYMLNQAEDTEKNPTAALNEHLLSLKRKINAMDCRRCHSHAEQTSGYRKTMFMLTSKRPFLPNTPSLLRLLLPPFKNG